MTDPARSDGAARGCAVFYNADFDLAIGGRAVEPAARRRSRLLSLCALVGCGAGDVALVDAEPDPRFIDTLATLGLPRPRWRLLPADQSAGTLAAAHTAPDKRLLPLGFDRRARAILALHHDDPPALPSLAALARVNARSYGVTLERELFAEACASRAARSLDEVTALVDQLGPAVVLKRERSSAGLGNLRVAEGAALGDDAKARAFAEGALGSDGVVIVERWQRRLVDVSVIFEVDASGAAVDAAAHETTQTDGGGHIGSLLGAAPPLSAAEHDTLLDAARSVAARLAADGYRGPVCLDAYIYADERGARCLRPLVEINARRPASFVAERLRRRAFPDRALLARFINRRRLRVPATHDAIVAALGAAAFDPRSRRGVFIASPLTATLDGVEVSPQKIAAFVVADDARAVRALEQRLRQQVVR